MRKLKKINAPNYNQVKASYLGHLSYGNTNNLISRTINKMDYNKLKIKEVLIKDNELFYFNKVIYYR